jgi:anhydro-N-acetylmuramic acid kinase
MKPLNVLGIMSGTSLDGVDYALCRIREDAVRLLRLWQVRFPARLRARLHAAASNQASSHELAQLHHDLGRFYASAALRPGQRERIDLVGLHGQTLFHHPPPHDPATFQAGEPAYLSETFRVPVISNFRVADLAAGGQGAPLATLFHVVTFGRRGAHVCVNNLGGISNVTSIDWRRGAKPRVRAFDTGPANLPIDLAMRTLTDGKLTLDRNGRWAAQGRAHEGLLRRWLNAEFIRRPPPKSTGREHFGEPFLERALTAARRARLNQFELLATLTEFTARSLALNYACHLPAAPEQIILTGGGAANPVLVRAIQAQLPNSRVVTSEDLGWPRQSIEPAAFALLASRRWRRLPANLPGTTGARRAVLLGQITETDP